MSAVQDISRKYVPEHKVKTNRNNIPRERVLMRRRTKVENHLDQHTKIRERSRLRAALVEIEESLQQSYVKV